VQLRHQDPQSASLDEARLDRKDARRTSSTPYARAPTVESIPSQHDKKKYPSNPLIKAFQCTYCDTRFGRAGTRDNHEKEVHDATFNFTCTQKSSNEEAVCGKEFSSWQGFKNHHAHAHVKHKRSFFKNPGSRGTRTSSACGVCRKLFRGSELAKRSAHIKKHWEPISADKEQLYHWKTKNWTKSNIAAAFLEQKDVQSTWETYAQDKATEAGTTTYVVYDWDEEKTKEEWDHFIEVAEFGDVTDCDYVDALVRSAYKAATLIPLKNVGGGSPTDAAPPQGVVYTAPPPIHVEDNAQYK
jgi:hypothetical protein